jgi:REP element-mobilizing transposase RayT
MWKHWVVRASTPFRPFEEFNSARWVWGRLAEHFPEKIAAVLMPNHLHLILPDRKESDIYKLRGLLGPVSKRLGVQKLWQPIPIPSEIPDVIHLRRHVRYVALNPCRAGLSKDPLEWYWSTYREIMGASVERRDSESRLAEILGERLSKFQVRFHAYVSGDPSVQVAGTPISHAAIPSVYATYSIGEILDATGAAHLTHASDVKKRGVVRNFFIHFASRHGWRQPALLSQLCSISPSAVRLILKQTAPTGMEAADRCLGDPRLRVIKAFLPSK